MDGVYLLLGSNLGDKRSNLQMAVEAISEYGDVVNKSSVYETAAWGKTDQPGFLNQVIEISCDLEPHELLKRLQQTEVQLGRQRFEKWGERSIDIDILYFNTQVIESKNLCIPHPEIQHRRFTLVPLNEIAPQFIHPVLQQTQVRLLELCSDQLEVIQTPWK